jgi:hypothetical protein
MVESVGPDFPVVDKEVRRRAELIRPQLEAV